MCVPSPGPRCSYHAHKEYLVALKRFEEARTPEEKIVAGEVLEVKTRAYYSTPRGQNFLRREADSAEGLKRQEYLSLLKQAEDTREQQMHDFQIMVDRKNTTFKEKTAVEGRKFSRYVSAAALTLLFLKEQYPEISVTIIDKQTVIVGDRIKILVLPSKYQNIWGESTIKEGVFESGDESFDEVLNSLALSRKLNELRHENAFTWFERRVVESGYVLFASVNINTQDVAIFTVDKIKQGYSLDLKLKKRLGGTTYCFGEVDKVEQLLHGTVFEKGEVLELANFKKTIITGVPPQPLKDCVLSEEYFLGWRQNVEGEGYFEVRKRHISKKYDVVVKLKARRVLFSSGVDEKALKLLKASSV